MLLPPRSRSPVSPTPAVGLAGSFSSTFHVDAADDGPVQVYEDHASDGDASRDRTPEPVAKQAAKRTDSTPTKDSLKLSHVSQASDPEDFSEHDEENDPIVHSFGPFGDNILSRFQSFQPVSPERKRKPQRSSSNSPGGSTSAPKISISPVKNHVINQLAFSRIHSLPLSTIHSNLPAELRGAMAKPTDAGNAKMLTSSDLKSILDGIPCVGEISREGKDAAGKLLESEFYYVPEMDGDENRRDTVMHSLGRTSIRAARKSHKVCCPQTHSILLLPVCADVYACSNTTGSGRATERLFSHVRHTMLSSFVSRISYVDFVFLA